MSLVLLPHHGNYSLQKLYWTDQEYIRFSYLYLNPDFKPKKWDEINEIWLSTLNGETYLNRLHELEHPSILVLGCQRSGTTWINLLLGKMINRLLALDENQSFDFLFDGLRLDSHLGHHTYTLQTTFLVSERASYLSIPVDTLCIFVLRNPFSVCWSLLYHFSAFDTVWHARQRRFDPALVEHFGMNPSKLEKAMCLYLDSLHTARFLLEHSPGKTIIVDYDQLVLHCAESVEQIFRLIKDIDPAFPGEFLNSECCFNPNVDVSTDPLNKHQLLSECERYTIKAYCEQEYLSLRGKSFNANYH